MGRPRKYDPTWLRVHLRLPPELLAEVNEVATSFEMTKDEFVVEVLKQYLEAYKKAHG